MNKQQYETFQELMRLIAQYDWAVETSIDRYNGVTKSTAVSIRNGLVKLTKELTA